MMLSLPPRKMILKDTMMNNDVVYNLSEKQIFSYLRKMADALEAGDSMGGYIEYHWEENGTYSCLARYQVGNLHGQGSCLQLIGEE